MKIEIMVHTFWDDYVETERTHPPQTWDTELPVNAITIGCCDGINWIGNNDPAYQAIISPSALSRYSKSMENVDIRVRAGLLVRAADPIAEAERHAQALAVTQSGLIDLEDGFLQGPLSNVGIYLERLRELCPDAQIGCITATQSHVDTIRPYVDTLWQGAYFSTTPDTIDTQNVDAVIAGLHINFAQWAPEKTVGIILWAADNDPVRFLRCIRLVRAFGSEVMLFRRLIWTQRNIDVVRNWNIS